MDLVNACSGDARQVDAGPPPSTAISTERNTLSQLVLRVRETFCQDSSFAQEAMRPDKPPAWRKIMERQGSSGLSVREFCEHEEIAVWTFYHPRSRQRSVSAGQPTTHSDETIDARLSVCGFLIVVEVPVVPTFLCRRCLLQIGDGLF